MQKILVPLDGSNLAEQVLRYAESLVTQTGGALYLVNVVSPAPLSAAAGPYAGPIGGYAAGNGEVAQEVIDAETGKAKEYLQEVTSRLEAKGMTIHPDVRFGTPSAEILAAAQEHGVDLIAISTHGRSGLGRTFFGSVADDLLRESGLPVMVIKPTEES